MKPRILIVEDEESIQKGLVDLLTFHGYEADAASDGKEGLDKALNTNPHLILLDVMLPHIDGFTICGKIRETDRSLPIIMLTAKGDEDDIIKGLKLGADDYIPKPFSLQELLARIEAVLRRSSKLANDQEHIEWDGLVIDCENLTLKTEADTLELTQKEADLLKYLIQFEGQLVTRQDLLKEVWGYANPNVDTRTIDIHINKVRKKIEADPQNPVRLLTLRGKGYRIQKA